MRQVVRSRNDVDNVKSRLTYNIVSFVMASMGVVKRAQVSNLRKWW